MKIIIDARLYGIENAGIGRYVMNLVSELQKQDKENKYILLLRNKYFSSLKTNSNFKKILCEIPHYSLNEQIKLKKIIEEINYDLVHFPHFNVPIGYKRNYVVTIHDLLMHKTKGVEATTLSPLKYYVKRLGYKKVFGAAIINSKKIIVPTKFVKNDLLNSYKIEDDKVIVTYESFDKKIKAPVKNKSVLRKYKIVDDYFLYVGNAYPHKNLKRAVEAIKYLNERLNNYEQKKKVDLVIVSSRNVFSERIMKLASGVGAEKNVKLINSLDDSELAALYINSIAFLYPSLHEGFGLPGLEAMSLGTLVLASDISVFREVYGNNALYFNPYDFSSIERLMFDVINMNDKKINEITNNAKKFVNKYSWEKMARETLNVYKMACDL